MLKLLIAINRKEINKLVKFLRDVALIIMSILPWEFPSKMMNWNLMLSDLLVSPSHWRMVLMFLSRLGCHQLGSYQEHWTLRKLRWVTLWWWISLIESTELRILLVQGRCCQVPMTLTFQSDLNKGIVQGIYLLLPKIQSAIYFYVSNKKRETVSHFMTIIIDNWSIKFIITNEVGQRNLEIVETDRKFIKTYFSNAMSWIRAIDTNIMLAHIKSNRNVGSGCSRNIVSRAEFRYHIVTGCNSLGGPQHWHSWQ